MSKTDARYLCIADVSGYSGGRIQGCVRNPSVSEGRGLPAMEAMACGCALVSADNQGVRDFTIDGKSALLAPVQRPDLLAEQLYTVMTNEKLRVNLAQAAEQPVRRFTWERAVNALEALFAAGASR